MIDEEFDPTVIDIVEIDSAVPPEEGGEYDVRDPEADEDDADDD